MRLAPYVPEVVHVDQVGFVLNRQAGDNTRRMFNIIDILNQKRQESVILSLDAEKAFDRLSWPFLFATLDYLGISGAFAAAIRGLYSTPTAKVKLPVASSFTFSIRNGTRQGCPLSPLLFALCMEPFAAHV